MAVGRHRRKRALTAAAGIAAAGLPLGVVTAAGAQSPAAAGVATAAATGTAPAGTAGAVTAGVGTAGGGVATRRLAYRGYTFAVPRAWPVIDLTTHPGTCVRFDRHAVYVGQPGARQACPSGLVGATEALLIQPGAAHTAARSTEDPVAHRIVASAPRIQVTASYRAGQRTIVAVLRSAGLPAPVTQDPATMGPAAGGTRPGRTGQPAVPAIPIGATNYTGPGFDACTAPSTQDMSAWLAHSRYRAVGIYIGGSDRACAQPSLTAAWVSQEAALGWHFIPLYVGPQVAYGEVKASTAAEQATASAQDAAGQAQALGFGPGTPLYYDMEAYHRAGAVRAMTFFAAWTTELHVLGYRSAIYSSSSSGISDLVSGYTPTSTVMPDVINDAWWNGAANTLDPAVPVGDWANHQRVHQYAGNVWQTHGGVRIGIDKDYLDVQVGNGGGGGGPARVTPSRQASQAAEGPGGVVDAFYAGAGGALWCAGHIPGAGWAAPVRIGGALASQPSAVTAPGGRVEVFYRGPDGGLWAAGSGPGGGWPAPERLTVGTPGGAPRAVSTHRGAIEVFWRGAGQGELWSARFTPGSGWQPPQRLASGLTSDPAPAVSGANTVSVFWRGTGGQLWHMSHGPSGVWSTPSALPASQAGAGPSAAGQRNGQVDVFWPGTTPGTVWYTAGGPSGWATPALITRGATGTPVAVASAAYTAEAFWPGSGGRLWYATRHGAAWGAPERLPAVQAIAGDVFAVSRGNGVADVFWKSTIGDHLWHARYHQAGGTWSLPGDLGGPVTN